MLQEIDHINPFKSQFFADFLDVHMKCAPEILNRRGKSEVAFICRMWKRCVHGGEFEEAVTERRCYRVASWDQD